MSVHRLSIIVMLLLLAGITGCAGTAPSRVKTAGASQWKPAYQSPTAMDETVNATTGPGLGHQLIWYIPNRFLDLMDVFRIRLRAGPGLAANVRLTDYADVFIGTYYTAFVGLPGPRLQPDLRWPWGLEYEKGLKLMGVDASDDLNHEPGYSPTECNAGVQFLMLGLELGFDPVEFADFFSGLILIDLREDDR